MYAKARAAAPSVIFIDEGTATLLAASGVIASLSRSASYICWKTRPGASGTTTKRAVSRAALASDRRKSRFVHVLWRIGLLRRCRERRCDYRSHKFIACASFAVLFHPRAFVHARFQLLDSAVLRHKYMCAAKQHEATDIAVQTWPAGTLRACAAAATRCTLRHLDSPSPAHV